MAQLKDTIVSGNLRVTDTTLTDTLQVTTIKAPTSSGTYGPGTSGQVLKSNGTSVYWGSDSNSVTGVKGNAESSYRTGNVNLTPANIGALASTTKYAASSSVGGPALSVSTAGGDVVLGTSGSSSDDSGDIYWKYGNGQEKARLYLSNTYTAKEGPLYRIFKSDGTGLYSGRLPLADGTSASGTWGINITGNSANVTDTVAIAHGGTGATNRLAALRALTEQDVGTSAQYFLTITNSWGQGGYTSVANAKTVLGLKSAAYTESSEYAPSSHTHGNITNGGALQTTDITIASGDKLVVTDSSDSNKVARASISFDGSTATKCLTQKGTWETFASSNTDIKVNVTLAATTKAYLLGTSTTPTATAQAVTSVADTGVYLGTTAGSLYATSFYENGTSLASKYAAIGHKHTTTIAADSGTNQLTLAASTKYKLTAGETNFIFTTPPNTTYSAGTGLSLSGTTFNHSNSVTAVANYNKPYVKYDAQGHITGSSYWTATAAGTSDESGWIKVATMVHTDTHDDTPIMLLVSQRGNTITYKLHIVWKNTSNTDPDIDKFRLSSDIDTNADAYIKKSTTSTWELYIKKLDNWDAIAMHLYVGKYFPDHMTWTWQDVQTAESAITGGIEAEKIVPYNYYQSRTANTVLAAPNGSDGGATFRKLVAADLPSHTHNYAGSSSAGGPATNIAIARVTKDSKVFPGANKVVFEEYTNGTSYNLPSNHYYHIMSVQGPDTKYGTQLALGMTTTAAYYRVYNNQTWSDWKSLINTNTTYSANNGVGLSGTTFYNSGVRAVSTGSADGTISVNTNGSTDDVAVKGLASAAYVTQESLLRARSSVTTDGGATGWSQIGVNQYNGAYPDGVTNKIYNWGAVVSIPTANARFDLYYNHNSSTAGATTNGLQYRTGWDNDKKAWRMLLDSGNYKSYEIVLRRGNAGKSNMNDVGRLYASVGMTELSDPENNYDNPMNGTTKSTSWHLYWDASYKDDPNGSNAWVAQIANKAGTAQWWVRSRKGGTITNGTEWDAGWEHLTITSQAGAGSAANPVYVDSNGHTQACTYSLNKTVPSNAVFTDTTYSAGNHLTLSGTTFKVADYCKNLNGGDWNTVTTNGWYMGSACTNAPSTAWWIGHVHAHNNKYCIQELWNFDVTPPDTANPDAMYMGHKMRWFRNSTWGPWVDVSTPTPSAKVNCQFGTVASRTTNVTRGWMAYWDGSYDGSASNLTYCNKGAFGTIVTKNTGDYVPMSGSMGVTGNIEITKASGDVGFYAKRSDTGVEVWMGVGSGGTNHGIYSNKLGKWMMYGDATDVHLNGNAATATKLETPRTINGVSFDGSANITIPRSIKHIHTANGTDGSGGWVKIARITVTEAYADQPMTFTIAQRRIMQYRIHLLFTNSGSVANTAISEFIITRDNSWTDTNNDPRAYIIKPSDGIFDLYIRKTVSWDRIFVVDFTKADDGGGINYSITWENVHVADSAITGGTEAVKKLYLPTSGGTVNGAITASGTGTFRTDALGTQLIVERTDGANMAGITFKNTSGVLGYIAANTVDGDLYHYGATDTSTMKYAILDTKNCSNYTFKVTRGSSKSTATSGYWAAMCNSTQTGSPVLPTSGKWWHVISMDWTNNDVKNWISQLAIATQEGSGVWWRRNDTGGTSIDSYSWHRLAEGNSSGAATHVETSVATTDGARPVFYAYLGDNTRVVYNTNFTYNPSGNVLTATTFAGNTFKAGKASTTDGEMLFYNSGGSGVTTLKASAKSTSGTYLLPERGNLQYTLSCGHEDLSAATGSLSAANVVVPSYTKFIKIVFKSDSSTTLYSMVEIPYFGNGDYSALVQVGTYGDGQQGGSPRIVMKAVIINITDGTQTGKKSFTVTASPTTKINGSNISNYTRNITIHKIYATD